jgi:hypothetical protein
MILLLLLLLLLVFIVSAAHWGVDSRDTIKSAEWKRRSEHSSVHHL